MHGTELREHRAAPVPERDVGEDHDEVPVLVEHPVAGGLQQVEAVRGRDDQPVLDRGHAPAHAGVPGMQRTGQGGGEVPGQHAGDLGREHETDQQLGHGVVAVRRRTTGVGGGICGGGGAVFGHRSILGQDGGGRHSPGALDRRDSTPRRLAHACVAYSADHVLG